MRDRRGCWQLLAFRNTTLEEADDLLDVATKSGALIQTGHVERFNRAIRAALPYVDTFVSGHSISALDDVLDAIERA